VANCPVCQSEIVITSQHFGTLYSCPKCSAVFFVDWGGQPEAAASTESFTETASPAELFNDEGPAVNQFGGDPMGFESAPYEQEPVPHEEIPVEEPPPSQAYEAAPVEEEASYDFSQPLEATPEPMTPLNPDSNPLSEITNFGNADLGQTAFSYTIMISGIDSSAIRTQLQEAITDSKFGWNVIQVMAQIKGGVLTIKSVNAVKASILIQRVKYLPVKISWRQDVLSSTV
jgi:hypothetical protein